MKEESHGPENAEFFFDSDSLLHVPMVNIRSHWAILVADDNFMVATFKNASTKPTLAP